MDLKLIKSEQESHPDSEDLYLDPEPWKELIEKLESDWGNYMRFEKMDSREGFTVMENFAYSMTDSKFREKLLDPTLQAETLSEL
ncbi:hypothetical protein [Algoriphagus persicinus]|uniref:hypothetical protein n=1 Tax=Algoriphagus persicinus TaxID=3108754 RepID=UPI002B3A3A2D|nr:hypothetical protein [Algoriphagus sp. E1-3-M2]MEB2783236.1 hypothetical protein [Algoriphagus sp. E1-3-M2]